MKPRDPFQLGAWKTPLSFLAVCGVFSLLAFASETVPRERLGQAGYLVSQGAAPGYVDDRLCGSCHQDLYASFQEVGMARSFYRPRAESAIEDFSKEPFFHAPSKRYYEMRRTGDRYLFRRFQLDAGGRRVNEIEQPIDWILGSGHTSRTYLYSTPSGELYQLPVAWYTQSGRWGMAPGYDRPDHLGINRRVLRECMFCHNAYPDVPVGSDTHDAPHVYPGELPEGIGCQRCHGPGAEHARLALDADGDGKIDFDQVSAAIVHPGRLPVRLRNDICYGCHMQPSVSLPGMRRLDRADYSFRPGEPLADYLVQLEVEEADLPAEDRFEINHHPYRLEQSRCFQESAEALSCLTCHDPHRKVPVEARAEHYRQACLGCHQGDEGTTLGAHLTDPARSDCVACHMPRRRTQDVVHVVMTDHRIQRRGGGETWLAPRGERDPSLVAVEAYEPERAPKGKLGELYAVMALVEAGAGSRNAKLIDRLKELVPVVGPEHVTPALALVRGQLGQKRFDAAASTALELNRHHPGHPLVLGWLGIAQAAQRQDWLALDSLRRAIDVAPERAEAHFNLGRVLVTYGRPLQAIGALRRAVELQPNMARGWQYLGEAHLAVRQAEKAASAFRRGLAVDPRREPAYLGLGRALLAMGEKAEAARWWRHGLRVAARSDELTAALAALTAGAPPANPPGDAEPPDDVD